MEISPGCHVLCWVLGNNGYPKSKRESEKGRKGTPGRGNSTGEGLEVRKDRRVVGELQDAEGTWRAEGKGQVTEKRARRGMCRSL